MPGAHGSITDNGNGVAALDYTTDLVGIGDAYTAMNERPCDQGSPKNRRLTHRIAPHS
jgi:hypothetical protein